MGILTSNSIAVLNFLSRNWRSQQIPREASFSKGWPTFSRKDFVGHRIFVTTTVTQLSHCGGKTATDYMSRQDMVMFQWTFTYENRWWGGFEDRKAPWVEPRAGGWTTSAQLATAGTHPTMGVSTSPTARSAHSGRRSSFILTCPLSPAPRTLLIGPGP